MLPPSAALSRLRGELRTVPLREVARELLRAYARNELLTFASAIAFKVLFAFIPFALFAFGLLGTFGLTGVWQHDVAPQLKGSVSPPAFELIDNTVRRVLSSQQLFWVTVGLAIAVWEMSGATRCVMDVFDRIYESRRDRSFRERYTVSVAIAVAAGALLLAATAVFMLGPLASGVLTVLRWPVSALLMLAAIAVFIRFAPADRQSLEWVSVGSLLAVTAWLGTSVAFAFYIRELADYGTVYGALAVVIVAFEYVYLAAIAFLTGAQLDQLIRARAQADRS
ncbi:MAG: rane protein [Solirubrobacteraceae bacterium]|nr:rane protein [Solirubrobacteraceae bacterium]